jgi:nondiscriminating aspartyl-tRNA synthetase
MQRIYTTEVAAHVGERVQVAGWLHTLRRLGGISFLVLRDVRGAIQVVLDTPEALAALEGLLPETVLTATGTVVAEPQAPGGIEIHGPTFEILSPVHDALPFPLNKPEVKATLPTFLDHAVIGHRHPARRSVMRLQAGIMAGFRTTLTGLGFTEIQTPKLVGSATEGGANVFTVDYFGRPAYLAQSPQFYKQIMVGVFERVFEVGPVFRAEPHATTRHLNEYISLDLEMGFIQDHRDVMALIAELLREMLAAIGERAGAALETLGVTLPAVGDIPIVGFSEAQEIILREFGEDARGEPDLAPQHERWLGEWARREHNSEWIFVEGYPTAKRPFYTMPNPEAPAASNSFDLLFRGLELITGGQREHRYNRLVETMEARQIDPAPFVGYLDAFRFGMPPEGGCAIGLERFVAQLVGAANVREVTAFPRDINRLTP